MSWANVGRIAGGIVGGVAGGIVGGPAGAVGGAGLGSAAGGAIGGMGDKSDAPQADTQSPNSDYNAKGNFTNPNSYGYQNFTPGAQQQSDFYNHLAATQAGQQAPTVAPVGINFGGATGQAYAPAPQAQPQAGQPVQQPAAAPALRTQSQPYQQGGGPTSIADAAARLRNANTPMSFSPNGGMSPRPVAPMGADSPMTQRLQSGQLDDAYKRMSPPGQGNGEFDNPLFKQQQETRGIQQGFIGRLGADMNGGAPSAAQAQLQSGLDQSIAAQNAMAASAGPGNYAAAQRASQGNAAQMSQQAANQSAILRAQEYAGSRDAMAGALGAARNQDLSGQGQSYNNAIAQANLQAGQASDQAHLQEDQNKLNVIGAQGYYGMGQHGQDMDLNSRMHMEDLLSGKYANDHGLAQNASQFDTAESDKRFGTAAAAGSALIPYLTKSSGSGGAGGGDGF